MATLGHLAVGAVAARLYSRGQEPKVFVRALVGFGALALAPDLDVIGLAVGIPYPAQWGHRGATHSICFAALVSLALALLYRGPRKPLTVGLLAFLAIGSHGPLDALTDGGLGVALLWPFSVQRFFASVTPIRVAPIGLRMLSMRGLSIVAREAVLFLPLWLFALWPRAQRSG